jgi:hypothetical protein
VSCQCKVGYTGNGQTCALTNACAINNGGCDMNASCSLNGSSALCTCKVGYMGNGMTCTPTNACTVNNGGCDANATCSPTGSTVSCTCKMGYVGSGKTCSVASDPCQTNNGGCDANATCANVNGAASCTCKAGYKGTGTTCAVDNTAMMEATSLNAVAQAILKFHTDTGGGWPWGNTSWDVGCGQIDPSPFTTNDKALFSQIVGQPGTCTGPNAGGAPPPWSGPYLSPGPTMGSPSEFDAWSHVLMFAYIRPPDGFGGGDPSAPNGAIVIWSTGPDGLDQTGCTSTAQGTAANCLLDYSLLVQGKSTVPGDDIIVLVGPAQP